jgi:PhzF family phenazine biosynthesis protein
MLEIYQIDAFANEPFKGNPAAVCILEKELDERIYQKISAEMNLSETAFVYPLDNKNWREAKRFSLRWFTPLTEVPLCGHATLATAKVLFTEFENQNPELEFETKSGILKAQKKKELILLDFPINKPKEIDLKQDLSGIMGYNNLICAMYNQKMRKLLLHIEDENVLKQLKPDFSKLMSQEFDMETIGIIVTTTSSEKYDFISRFFAPWVGVNEDPVTGAAHTVLYPYWSKLLGKDKMLAFQASKRGGEVHLRSKGSDRIELGGNGILVLKGKLEF